VEVKVVHENDNRHDLIFQNAAGRSPIRRFLIPIDALEVKPVDLKPILEVAERFNAEVTLLHCYEIPPSFDYAIGPSALIEVTLHRDMVKTRLLKLCTEVRKFFAKCRCEFAVGSLPVEILRASDTLHADLIVVPLSLDLVSHSWTTKELLDELVRKANCSVLEIPVASRGFNMKILETERSSDKLVSKKRWWWQSILLSILRQRHITQLKSLNGSTPLFTSLTSSRPHLRLSSEAKMLTT
jgi:nucleotide-binding universal stress UspA family protein